MNEVELETIKLTAMLSASEDWADLYGKTPEQHAELLSAEAEMQVVLTKFFRNMQKKVADFVNWDMYGHQVQLDYNVQVVVNEQQIDDNDGQFIKVTLNTVKKSVLAGFVASETGYNIPLGISSTSALIQELSMNQVASLVGKKVLEDGSIIDNPNARYNIMETVRKDIVQSVKTSLGLGETTDEATARMSQVIAPVERAARIARTEAVNAYQAGVREFGVQSNAVGKVWLTAGATDICEQYAQLGPVPFDYEYGSGLLNPTAHTNCRCAERLIYQQEWDNTNHK
jgi:hypothetical protein